MGIAQQSNAQTAADIGFNHIARVVMRVIVADYDFRRWIGLVKRAVDGLANVGLVVKAGDEYGDRGFPRKTPQCDRSERPRYRCNCHTVEYPPSILSDRISPASCAN